MIRIEYARRNCWMTLALLHTVVRNWLFKAPTITRQESLAVPRGERTQAVMEGGPSALQSYISVSF